MRNSAGVLAIAVLITAAQLCGAARMRAAPAPRAEPAAVDSWLTEDISQARMVPAPQEDAHRMLWQKHPAPAPSAAVSIGATVIPVPSEVVSPVVSQNPEPSPQPSFAPVPVTINIDSGPIKGVQGLNGSVMFLGIPFAAPPVGNLRWKRPVPVQGWNDTKTFGEFPPACMQEPWPGILPEDLQANLTDTNVTDVENFSKYINEDCLYLNVFTPPGAIKDVNASAGDNSTEKLPVMVYIHGGGFDSGSSRLYNGSTLVVRENVILVVIQFRLGVFGFGGSDLLMSRDADNSTGNYGLQDQRFALEWVKANIEYFGGDPQNVLIFGSSTGGYSVGLHMVSQESAGLFQKVIMQSGGLPTWLPYSLNTANAMFKNFLNGTNCIGQPDVVACLQGLSAADILMAQLQAEYMGSLIFPAFVPVIDNYEFKQHPLLTLNQIATVPAIMGTNEDDGSSFNNLPYNATMQDVKDFLNYLFSQNIAEAAIQRYDVESFDTPWDLLTHILGDFLFACPTLTVANRLNDAGQPPFLYDFQHRSLLPLDPLCPGVCHGEELPYVFPDIYPKIGLGEMKLSQRIDDMWGNFARRGTPTITAAAVNQTDNSTAIEYTLNWRAVNGTLGVSDYYLRIDTVPNTRLLHGYHPECDMWGDLLANFANATSMA